MELLKAQKLAIDICYRLQPFCNRINIAGSIRRKKADVKDIEICVSPLTVLEATSDLFGAGITTPKIHADFIAIVNDLGKIEKGTPHGRYMKIVLPEGINLDLFIPLDFDYYRQYAIRTGSADFSAKVIAYGWKKIGWCGSDLGLRRTEDCSEHRQPDGKIKYKCERNKNNAPPVWESERSFFDWIKVKYLEPQLRNI